MFSHATLAATLSALILLQLSSAIDAREDDYLTPELRARVDALKVAVATTPTTPASAAHRVQTLWDWANAFALAGKYVPVNLTAAIRPNVPGRVTQRATAALDGFVRELALHDDDPDAIGTLTADLGPFEARTHATFQQTYTVGTRPIEAGGGIVVAKHFMANHGRLQTSDPSAANYITIASESGARFAVDGAPVAGMHGGFRGAARMLFFRLESGTLREGDKVTITYGARSGDGPGLVMPSFSSDRMPFPLYLVFDPSGHQYSVPIQPIRVVGSDLSGVHGFAPSVVRPDEAFDISIRAEDRFYNRAKAPFPAWQVRANGNTIGEVPSGEEPIAILRGVRFEEEGVYRLTITSADGRIAGVANPVLVSATEERVYWGDTHGHSGFAEGVGTPDRFMTWARDDARLDFVTHSEHDIWTDDHEWEVLKDNVAKYSAEGRFIAFLGYEWTTRNIFGGHHNVLFRTPEDRKRVGTQFFPTLSDLYEGLRRHHEPEDVVVIPHAHQSGNYRMGDPKLQPLVEIMSQHGTFEWFGRMYLRHGHQVGFIAASDNHLSQPGYTAPRGGGLSQRGGLAAIRASELGRDAVFDAMKSLNAYATTGDRIILSVQINGERAGQRIQFTKDRKITGRVVGTAPIESITLIKNDEEIWQKDYLTIEKGRYAEEETFYVSFDTESKPLHPGDNPRGWRPWRGELEVVGADLVAAEATDFFNADIQALTVRPEENLVVFATATRGDSSSLKLTLRNIKRSARIQLRLDEGREFGGGPPIFRQHAPVSSTEVELRLSQLERGVLVQSVPLGSYLDRVTLRRRIQGGDDDVAFSIDDTGEAHGDYYFVRIRQVNDAMAWSSPIWVGGYANR